MNEAVRTRTFWLLLVAMSSPSIVSTALMFHHVSLMDSRGVDASTAAVVLSDMLPNRYILAAGQVFLVLSLTLALTISHTWHAFLYGAVLGTGGGATMTTSAVIWANYFGRGHLGPIRGASQVGMVAAAMGPLPFSLLCDITGGYNSTFFLILPVISATAALLATPPPKKKPSSSPTPRPSLRAPSPSFPRTETFA